MKYAIAFPLFLAAAPLIVPALAASFPSQSLTVNSTVPTRCKMLPPSSNGAGTILSQNDSGAEINLSDMVDATTDKTKSFSAQIAFPITCTGAHTLVVTTQNGGLTNSSGVQSSGGFLSRADYTLGASWANTTKSLQTAGARASLDLSQSGPASGNLVIDFSLAAGAGPMIAGTYSDTVVVQVNSAE